MKRTASCSCYHLKRIFMKSANNDYFLYMYKNRSYVLTFPIENFPQCETNKIRTNKGTNTSAAFCKSANMA